MLKENFILDDNYSTQEEFIKIYFKVGLNAENIYYILIKILILIISIKRDYLKLFIKFNIDF